METCAHEGVISRVSGTLSSLYFWLWIMVAYKRRCRGCRDWGRKSPNERCEEGGGADRDEWILRRHIGGVCRMQMGDIGDIALRRSGIRCTERTADMADDISRWMFFRMTICHFNSVGGDCRPAFTPFGRLCCKFTIPNCCDLRSFSLPASCVKKSR